MGYTITNARPLAIINPRNAVTAGTRIATISKINKNIIATMNAIIARIEEPIRV